MKYIVCLLFIALPYTALAQLAKKLDNTIHLITDRSPEENYTQFGRYLIKEGYSFAVSDKEFMMLKTAPKTSLNNRGKQSSSHHQFTITFNNSNIRIKPEFETLTMGGEITWIEWQHKSAKGDFNYMNWHNNFKPLLENYPGKTEIRYSRE